MSIENQSILIWQAVTDRIADIMTGCTVSRSYDPIEQFSDIQEASAPSVFVVLDGKRRAPMNNIASRITENYNFTVVIASYITAQNTADRLAELDTCIETVDTLAEALIHRIEILTSGLKVVIMGGETVNGEMYDVDYLSQSEMFVCLFSVDVQSFKEVE